MLNNVETKNIYLGRVNFIKETKMGNKYYEEDTKLSALLKEGLYYTIIKRGSRRDQANNLLPSDLKLKELVQPFKKDETMFVDMLAPITDYMPHEDIRVSLSEFKLNYILIMANKSFQITKNKSMQKIR